MVRPSLRDRARRCAERQGDQRGQRQRDTHIAAQRQRYTQKGWLTLERSLRAAGVKWSVGAEADGWDLIAHRAGL